MTKLASTYNPKPIGPHGPTTGWRTPATASNDELWWLGSFKVLRVGAEVAGVVRNIGCWGFGLFFLDFSGGKCGGCMILCINLANMQGFLNPGRSSQQIYRFKALRSQNPEVGVGPTKLIPSFSTI